MIQHSGGGLADKPAVSVIIPAYQSWDSLPSCLGALDAQVGGIPIEIIVAASGCESVNQDLALRFPHVRFLLSPERKFSGAARNWGAREARGEILLFLDADCVLSSEGVLRVVESLARHPRCLVGGAIGQGEPANGIAWGHYFSSFTPWMPGKSRHPRILADVAAGCCFMQSRDFRRFGPFAEVRFCSDTLLSWHTGKLGGGVLFDPSVQICHNSINTMTLLIRRKFRHGRAFGHMRAKAQSWGRARRWGQIVALPLVPWLMLWRCGRQVSEAGVYRRQFLCALPATFAALLA